MTKRVPLLREMPKAQRDLVAALLRAQAGKPKGQVQPPADRRPKP